MHWTMNVFRILSVIGCVVLLISAHAQKIDSSEVRSIAWSPDGTRIAVGSGYETCNAERPEDYAIQIVDAATGDPISRLVHHQCTATSLDWNRHSTKVISSAGADPELSALVWDVASQTMLVRSIAFSSYMVNVTERRMDRWSPGNSRVMSVFSGNPHVHFWDPELGYGESGITTTNVEETYAADWSPDGKHVVTVHNDGIAVIWELHFDYATEVARIEGHRGNVTTVVWSGDGGRVFTGSDDGMIRVWDTETWTLRHVLGGHTSTITSMDLAPDHKTLASASTDGTVRVWDVSSGEELEQYSRPQAIYTVDWSPDGTRLVYGGADSDEITIVELRHPATSIVTPAPSRPTMNVERIRWSPDGNTLAVAGTPETCSPDDPRQPNIQLLDGRSLRVIRSFWLQGCRFVGLDWSPDGSKLTVSDIGVFVLDVESGQVVKRFRGWQATTAIDWNPTSSYLAVGSVSGVTTFIDADTGDDVANPVYGRQMSWSPDGRRIATGNNYDGLGYIADFSASFNSTDWIVLVGPPPGEYSDDGHWDEVNLAGFVGEVDWRSDGEQVAGAGSDYSVWVWDADTGEVLYTFPAHSDYITALAWRPGTNQITTASNDGTIFIAEAGQEIARIQTVGQVRDMDWSPDGAQLAFVDSEGGLKVVDSFN